MMLKSEQINNHGLNFKAFSLRLQRLYILTAQIHRTIWGIQKYSSLSLLYAE